MSYSPAWRNVTIVVLRPLLYLLLKRDWRGQSNVPPEEGVILATNHLSNLDPLVLSHYVYKAGRYPVFLAKAGVFRAPVIGTIIRKTGQIPVYRDRTDAGLALREAEVALREKQSIIFYPEGTCTRDPELWPMTGKTGAARLALTTGAKVVPIAHWGAQDLLRYGSARVRLFPRKRMHVIAGPPVDLSKYEGAPLDNATLGAATMDIMRAIAGMLGELRGETPPEQLYDHRQAVKERRAKTPVEEDGGASS
jgi:1-acyl-sn-glycerol-3-phosphate acyltransferase